MPVTFEHMSEERGRMIGTFNFLPLPEQAR